MTPALPETARVLITGITSIHGWPIFLKLREIIPEDRLFGIAPPRSRLPDWKNLECADVVDRDHLARIRERFKPDRIVHCAGVCDLDLCEERPEWARSINVMGTKNIIETFGKEMPLLYMSTDLVFSGNNPPEGGYSEEHTPDPVSVVGRTMLEAENEVMKRPNHCIVRLGLPLGDSINGDKGAIDWIEGRFKRNLPASLFYDEFRSCITCKEIGEMAAAVLAHDLRGLYHLGGEKPWSLHEIGEYVISKGYKAELLKGRMRHEEINGPPRVGNIALNSGKILKALS